MIEIHRRFDRFAASSVRCLSEASSQRELADKRPVKTPSMDFVFQTPIIYFWFYLYVNNLEPIAPQIKIFLSTDFHKFLNPIHRNAAISISIFIGYLK